MSITSPLLLASLLLLPVETAGENASRTPPLAVVVGGEAPLYAELRGGGRLLDVALASRLWQQVKATPEIDAGLRSKQVRQAKSGLAMFARLLDRSPEEAVREVIGNELALAVVPRGMGDPALLLGARLSSPAEARRLGDIVHDFLTLVGEDDDYLDGGPIRTVNGDEFHATLGDCFLIANDRATLVDAISRAGQSDAQFGGSPTDEAPQDGARLFARADLTLLREAYGGDRLPEVYDNAIGALLAHGVNTSINRADRATAVLDVTATGIHLEATVDGEAAESARWTEPADASRLAFEVPRDTIATFILTRDFAEFYERRLELLDPSIEGQIVEFDNVVSIFFGGRSFGDEILPALGDEVALVIGPQRFGDAPTPPDIRLPGFALVASIVDDGLRKSDLLVAFQTTIGIVNADRAQNGLPSMLLSNERINGEDVASARFILDEDVEAKEMRMNASPTVAVVDRHLVIGSAKDHALEVIAALKRGGFDPADGANSAVLVDVGNLRAILDENSEVLIANRMLEEGENRAEAEAFWGRASQILSLVDVGRLRLDRTAEGLTLRLTVTPAPATSTEPSPEQSR